MGIEELIQLFLLLLLFSPSQTQKTMKKPATQKIPQSDPNPTRNPHCRRWLRNPKVRSPFSVVASAATPQLRWKLKDSDSDPCRVSDSSKDTRKGETVSARKIAAGIWHSEILQVEPDLDHQQPAHGLKHGLNPIKGIFHKHQLSAVVPDSSMERATKWDNKCSKPSHEVYQSFDHLKLLIDQQMTQASSLESKLSSELKWARAHITELESKRHSSKKKVERILKKHAEEKASWRIREQEKIQYLIDGMKHDLNFERRNRRRTEILNAKLVDELSEAKKSAKRFFHEYEKERKARELLEDVCDQLAKEVGEDREDVEESKRESTRARDELEEERKMLQMAEVWREERVQMKLIDAKLALENQYSQLKKLQSELESFLSSRNGTNLNDAELKNAELLIEAVSESTKIGEMEKFTYKPPPASEDIFSIFEEIQKREEPKEREIEPCHSSSPGTDIFLGKPTNGSVGDESEWETLSSESNSERNEDLRKSVSSISKLWPSCTDHCKSHKKALDDTSKLEHWSSPGSANSNVTRRMKGCIEWPLGIHKQSLKTRLLEARLESHKVQIRHVLRQKI